MVSCITVSYSELMVFVACSCDMLTVVTCLMFMSYRIALNTCHCGRCHTELHSILVFWLHTLASGLMLSALLKPEFQMLVCQITQTDGLGFIGYCIMHAIPFDLDMQLLFLTCFYLMSSLF